MELELNEYDRRPFTVIAVEVTLSNIEQVAEWCNGTLDTESTKLQGMNTTIDLPVIRLKGQGRDKERTFTVMVGCYVVNHKGNFRMYKPTQFREMFIAKKKPVTRSFEVKREDLERASAQTGIPIFQAEPDGITAKPVD